MGPKKFNRVLLGVATEVMDRPLLAGFVKALVETNRRQRAAQMVRRFRNENMVDILVYVLCCSIRDGIFVSKITNKLKNVSLMLNQHRALFLECCVIVVSDRSRSRSRCWYEYEYQLTNVVIERSKEPKSGGREHVIDACVSPSSP